MVASDEVDALIEAFKGYLREERMRGAETVKRYGVALHEFSDFLRRVHTDLSLSAITHRELGAFLRERATTSTKPSPTAWNMALSGLRAFYGYLNHTEALLTNPTLKLERHKIASREPVPLSLDEFLALVAAAEASDEAYRHRNVAIVQVLFHTALRVRELVSLDVDQVDWDARVFRDVRTKGSKWLSAPFNDMVAEALEAHVAARAQQPAASEGALFVSNRRTRLSVRSVQEIVSALGEAAGIARPVTPHLLRHSSATELVELGTPIRVVQEVCGHASVVTTERYVHVKSGARRQAIDALGARVAQARSKKPRAA